MSGRVRLDGWGGLSDILEYLKGIARETNVEWAKKLGVNPSKQLTLVKPSGTVSLLCSVSSGIHPKHSAYYLRRVTQDAKDPLTQLMIDEGVPYYKNGSDKVWFSFPEKAEEGTVTSMEVNPLDQLELWKTYNDHWCEGNPSQTIFYNDENFTAVQDWVWTNFDSIGGLSFFPKDDYIYDKDTQPILPITEALYKEALDKFPKDINWDRLKEYEKEDGTTSAVTMACSGNSCEMI